MQALGKLVLGGAALGVAYLLSKRTVEVGSDGIQRFSPEAQKKVVLILSKAGLTDTPLAPPATFTMAVVRGASTDASFVNARKFINQLTADGFKVLVTKNILEEREGTVLLMAASVEEAFEFAGKGSEFVMV